MAFTDITDPSNWNYISGGGWDGTKYDLGDFPTGLISFTTLGGVPIPGLLLRYTIDVIDNTHANLSSFIFVSVVDGECPGYVCRTEPVPQTGVVLEVVLPPAGVTNVGFYTDNCHIHITKIEVGDTTEAFFWTNLQELTEVV